MQFMLYETMLKKLKKRRGLSTKGNIGVTALEVWICLTFSAISAAQCHLLVFILAFHSTA